MTRVAEPMIDLHQALHDTKMIEMLRRHLDVPLVTASQIASASTASFLCRFT
jgi:hypothetical protein